MCPGIPLSNRTPAARNVFVHRMRGLTVTAMYKHHGLAVSATESRDGRWAVEVAVGQRAWSKKSCSAAPMKALCHESMLNPGE